MSFDYFSKDRVEYILSKLKTIIDKKQDKLTDTNKLSYDLLSNTPNIPSALSELSSDDTHRLVTDEEKETWNDTKDKVDILKSNKSTDGSILNLINNNAVNAQFAFPSQNGNSVYIKTLYYLKLDNDGEVLNKVVFYDTFSDTPYATKEQQIDYVNDIIFNMSVGETKNIQYRYVDENGDEVIWFDGGTLLGPFYQGVTEVTKLENGDWATNKPDVYIGGRIFYKTIKEAINEKINSSTMASEFDYKTTYVKNDYCVYDGNLYQCIANCNWVAPTNTSYWKKIIISDELANQNLNLNDLVTKIGKIVPYFSKYSMYEEGDYCFYNNDIYKCKKTIFNEYPSNTDYWVSVSFDDIFLKDNSELHLFNDYFSTRYGRQYLSILNKNSKESIELSPSSIIMGITDTSFSGSSTLIDTYIGHNKIMANKIEDNNGNVLSEKANMISIAPQYNAETTYAENNYCYYAGDLYKCILQCKEIVPTDTSYWIKISLESELKTLKSDAIYVSDDNADIPILTSDAIDLLVNSINTDKTQYSSNGYKEGFRIRSTGEEASTSQTGACCTGFIEISKGDELIFENIPIIASSDVISYSTSYANVALYDASFKILSENYQWSTFNRPENNCSVNNGLITSMTVNYFGSSASLSDVKYMRLTFIKTDDNPHIYKV